MTCHGFLLGPPLVELTSQHCPFHDPLSRGQAQTLALTRDELLHHLALASCWIDRTLDFLLSFFGLMFQERSCKNGESAPRWCAWTTHLPSGELFPGLPLLFGHDFLESPSDSYKFPKWGITLETIGDSDLPSYPSLCKELFLDLLLGTLSLNGLREISLGDYFDTCSGGLFINCLRDIFPKWGVESGWDYFSDRVDDAWWDVSWSPHRLHWYAWDGPALVEDIG